MTYGINTHTDTSRTKNLLRPAEIKVLRETPTLETKKHLQAAVRMGDHRRGGKAVKSTSQENQ